MQWHASLNTIQASYTTDYTPVYRWVMATVDPGLLQSIEEELVEEDKSNLQELVRHLKRMIAPTASSTATIIRDEYISILKQAHYESVNPTRWHQDWHKACRRGLTYKIPEVQGQLAVKEFLSCGCSDDSRLGPCKAH
jgi:hypothetical protein